MDGKDKKVVTEQLTTNIVKPTPIYQPALFPIEIIETYPANEGSADLNTIGRGRNSKHYAIKTIHDGNGYVPASEFFCYELARVLSIPTPDFDYLSLNEGKEIAFGSVWEGGVRGIKNDNDILAILKGEINVQDLNSFFGKVFAFDLFVNNEDRHFGNYIFRDSFNNSRVALAFDFSRAWKVTGPYEYHCLDASCKTMMCNGLMQKFGQYDQAAAIEKMEEIRAVSKETIESILDGMHESWMPKEDKDVLLDWWGSKDFHVRIDKLLGVL